MNNFSFYKARDVKDAIHDYSAHENADFVAGGTNIIDLMKYLIKSTDRLIDINSLPECQQVLQLNNGSVRLGALVTNASTAYHPLIESCYPLLSKAILSGASAQIRNMATNGGNLLQRTRCYYFYDINTPCNKREPGSGCSAINGYNRIMAILGTSDLCIAVFPSDMCVALSALNAVVNIDGLGGKRSLPFADFHRLPGDTPQWDNTLQPGEIITSIDLPPKGFSENYSYLKLRDRNSYAFALVSVATAFELDDDIIHEARISLGGLAHKPWRVQKAEDFLRNKKATITNFSTAADLILDGAKPLKYNSFKIDLAKKAIIRNCIMALKPECQLPGAQPSL